jgi:hypothetical protein
MITALATPAENEKKTLNKKNDFSAVFDRKTLILAQFSIEKRLK